MGGRRQLYAIAIGSNRPRSRTLTPNRIVERAMERLSRKGFADKGRSPVVATAPLGPSKRRFANAAMLVETKLPPPELLDRLKRMERKAGRRPAGRWTARHLDLDIILWSGGCWAGDGVVIPHPAFRQRDFVLRPLAAIAPDWRDPLTGLRVRHLLARLR